MRWRRRLRFATSGSARCRDQRGRTVFFVHSGTSLGHVDMPEGIFHPNLHLYNQETVYDRLQDAGKKWAIYYGDVPQTLTMTHMLKYPLNFSQDGAVFYGCPRCRGEFPDL